MRRMILACLLALLSAAACIDIDEYGSVMKSGETYVELSFSGNIDVNTKSILGDVESVFSGGFVAVYDHDSGKLNFEQPVESLSGTLDMKVPSGKTLDYFFAGNMDFVFPENEEELRAMQYRISSFSDVAQMGIPIVGESLGKKGDPAVNIKLHRLFSKISLTIDHSGLDGGGDESWFRNSKLYVRQANAVLKPFGGPSSAVTEDDLLSKSDYDPEMANAHSSTFVYYAPENSGGLHPTFVEFTGTVAPSAGGYGGTVVYRFVVGGETGLEANKHYQITLGFNAGSLFEPSWSVELGDDWSDRRRFGLAADPNGAKVLHQGQVIAVRPSREGVAYLYFDKGNGVNHASDLAQWDEGFNPSDLSDAAWSVEAPGLEDHGLALAVSGGRLTFRVADPVRFTPGEEIPVTLHLYPGDLTYDAVVRTYEDISVEVNGGALTDDFYVGMKRGIKVKGLAGTTLYYRNSGFKNNSGMTVSPLEGAAPISSAREGVPAGEELDIYACGRVSGSDFVLELTSDDTFNDGDVLARWPVNTKLAVVAQNAHEYNYLGIDGEEIDVGYKYLDEAGQVIDRSRFDETLYERLLEPVASFSEAPGRKLEDWVGAEDGKIWLKRLKLEDGTDVADAADDGTGFLGAVTFRPKVPSAASGDAFVFVAMQYPYFVPEYPNKLETDYLNQDGPSGIHVSWPVAMNGNRTYQVLVEGAGSLDGLASVSEGTNGFQRMNWGFEDPEDGVSYMLPWGPQRTTLRFVNKHSGEIYDISAGFDVVHDVTLAVYFLFAEGAESADNIVITNAKNFRGLKCNPEASIGDYGVVLANLPGDYAAYLRIKKLRTISKTSRKEETTYGDIFAGRFTYADFRTNAYGSGAVWTADRIREFIDSGYNPITGLEFVKPGNQRLPSPLPEAYSGNPYFKISLLNAVKGHYIRQP